MYMSRNMTYEELVSIVQTIVKYDMNKYITDLQSISINPETACGSNQLFTERSGIDGRENLCGVPPEVVYHGDIVGAQLEDEEPFETERCVRRVHRCSSTALDIAGISEVQPNKTTADSENATRWVIPGVESNSFGMGGSRNLCDENGKFLYFFMSLGASLRGFQRCIRPVIAFDGTHLLGRFGGTMFVATTQDGNEQKGYCRNNDKASRVYTELQYNQHMEELQNLHQNAHDYVIDAGPHKWSCVHYPDRRYRVMTINAAECINSCLKFAQQLPMLTLAEFIRNMLQRWFHNRHRAAQSIRHKLTDAAHLMILKRVDKCNIMTLNPVDWNIFSVKQAGK
ncbi:hypothetical protein Ddye_023800 [Dipteronia dyeriana]|uniref:Uncharacterized protein n=1 Tax=Dipteronia dyeriana TaxID=168575 RepID=A0AAD9TTM1_9ROSI|nr:hypothetical protein Ddye_023800 [Dipteronia dyeriana]